MKTTRTLAAMALCALLLTPAHAAGSQARTAPVSLDGQALDLPGARIIEGTTYVPLRALAAAMDPQAQVSWERDRAVLRTGQAAVEAVPGSSELVVNGAALKLSQPVLLEEGRSLLPLRPLAALLGAETSWSPETGAALSTRGSDDLYWLSRIISAESRGEPFLGQVAAGNVVMNRVKSAEFPGDVYGVIFDGRWGGQFEPVRNGTVYNDPEPSCVLAARLCLAGASAAGESLYFLAPSLTSNHWTMENRTYVTTIGSHWFYE